MDEPHAAPHPRPRLRRALLVLLALCALALVVRSARKERGVLLHNQGFGARFLAGEDPYFDPEEGHRIHGPYPPSLSLVAAPLSLLPATAARVLWSSAQIAALVLVHHLLRKRTGRLLPTLSPRTLGLYVLSLLLVSRYLLRDMAAGGGNLLYMSLALVGLEEAWAGRPVRSGLATGLGLALKPNLAPLLLWYAVRRRWPALGAALLAALAWFWLPALVVGPGTYAGYARDWTSTVVAYASLEDLHDASVVPDGMPVPQSAMNQSLREAVFRLVRPPGDTGAADVRLVTLSPGAAAWLARGAQLLVVLLVVALARRASTAEEEWLTALAFLPACLLVSPITWKAHHVALLPLLYVLVAACALRPRPLRWLGGLLVVYYVVCDLANQELLGDRNADLLQAVSVVTWMDLVLLLACAALLRDGRLRRAAAESRSRAGAPS